MNSVAKQKSPKISAKLDRSEPSARYGLTLWRMIHLYINEFLKRRFIIQKERMRMKSEWKKGEWWVNEKIKQKNLNIYYFKIYYSNLNLKFNFIMAFFKLLRWL